MIKVLVIEDDETLRHAICRSLQQRGYDSRGAPDGRAGMDSARQDQPDLVITDIVMPDQDGIEAIVGLRALEPSPGIIAISGMEGPGGFTPLTDASLLGADAVLRKPFSMEELLAIAKKLVEERASAS